MQKRECHAYILALVPSSNFPKTVWGQFLGKIPSWLWYTLSHTVCELLLLYSEAVKPLNGELRDRPWSSSSDITIISVAYVCMCKITQNIMILQWFNTKMSAPWIFIILVCSLTRNDLPLFLIICSFRCHCSCGSLSWFCSLKQQNKSCCLSEVCSHSTVWKTEFQCKLDKKWMNPTTCNFPFYFCNLLEIMSTEGCKYLSTVWKCHPLRHDSRFGNIVNTNYLVNPVPIATTVAFPVTDILPADLKQFSINCFHRMVEICLWAIVCMLKVPGDLLTKLYAYKNHWTYSGLNIRMCFLHYVLVFLNEIEPM